MKKILVACGAGDVTSTAAMNKLQEELTARGIDEAKYKLGQSSVAEVQSLADQYGEDLVVVLGAGEAEAASLAAETVTEGDPTYAGPLAGVQLGLPVYHAFELKDSVDPGVYDDQAGMMEMVLDVDALIDAVKKFRA